MQSMAPYADRDHELEDSYAQSIEQVDPQRIVRVLDEGAATDDTGLLDVLYELMERALYPGKEELDDDEHTQVAWALEDGAYTVTRIRERSPLRCMLLKRFGGDARKMTEALDPAVIDELSGDVYALLPPEELAECIAGLLAKA
ncbi:hypothetical protein B1526_0469 [Bifidobacterium criceti]|uniref:Uncharacterized protein n=2 Tax=Bifidobacterium criceti TaxID=1960969 RepID=A0A2A2EGA7_9BIFI|nr:hypothetical protein B1526_0469 [Bifidobacterium criceti]